MIPIENVRVYDPKIDEIDLTTYRRAYELLSQINSKLAHSMQDGIFRDVMKSVVEPRKTLAQYLDDEGGYFSQNPDVFAVMFMDGKFHSKVSLQDFPNDSSLERIAEESNSIPFLIPTQPKWEGVGSGVYHVDLSLVRPRRISIG